MDNLHPPQRALYVVTTLKFTLEQRHDLISTTCQRCSNVRCPLGRPSAVWGNARWIESCPFATPAPLQLLISVHVPVKSVGHCFYSSYGHGKDVWKFLLLPIYMFEGSDIYTSGQAQVVVWLNKLADQHRWHS